jgi:biotin synthase-related radical SAM superfamily protein
VANCGFCPQARESKSSLEKLSRVIWPVYNFRELLIKLKYLPLPKKFKRICIQTLNYPQNFQDLIKIITEIRKVSNIPISVAIPPMSKEKLKELRIIGIERIGIALDGCTPEIFEKVKGSAVKGPYNWKDHLKSLKEALEVFSDGFVSTHLIIGLGETEQEVLERIEELHKLKILVSLFAFTPIRGTKLEKLLPPDLISYRKLQLARYLIVIKNKNITEFAFNTKGSIINININKKDLRNIIEKNDAFLTSGCPGCNRPYYTSRPSGPIYNFPRKLDDEEKDEIYKRLENLVNK